MPDLPQRTSRDREDLPFTFQVRLKGTRGEASFNVPMFPGEYLTQLGVYLMDGQPILIFPFSMSGENRYIRFEPHCPHCHGADCEDWR